MAKKATKVIQDIVVKNKKTSNQALKKILEKNTKPFPSEKKEIKPTKKKPALEDFLASAKKIVPKSKPKEKEPVFKTDKTNNTSLSEGLKTKKVRGKFVFNLIIVFAIIIVATKILDFYSLRLCVKSFSSSPSVAFHGAI